MNKNQIIILILSVLILSFLVVTVYDNLEDKTDVKELEDNVKFLENQLVQRDLEYDQLDEITNYILDMDCEELEEFKQEIIENKFNEV